jgi:TRAP-type C4-dicarboxylate transport system permease small subunit
MLSKLVDGYCKLLDGLIALALAIMVVLVFGNVVLRYAFNTGITMSEEVSRWLFVWLVFLGAISALKEHAHLGSDMLVSRLPRLGKKICLVLGQLLMLYITWLLFSGSLAQVKINIDVEAPVTGASVGIFYAAGVVFAVSAGLLLLRELWRTLAGQMAESELVMVQESEDLAQVEALHLNPAAADTAAVHAKR